MKDSTFFKQAELLLRILPIIYTENNFAVKGGTAINCFVREVPRLSVDIDLAYLPINSREEALNDIENSLGRIENLIQRVIPGTYCSKKLSALKWKLLNLKQNLKKF